MWYKDKTPITTEVVEAKEEMVNLLKLESNVDDFYYSTEYHGLILKDDCEIL